MNGYSARYRIRSDSLGTGGSLATFREYQVDAAKWITPVETEFYPDYLEDARTLYGPVLIRFTELVEAAQSSEQLFLAINQEAGVTRTRLLRVFRKYVSPITSVEMLKRKRRADEVVRDFGAYFRSLEDVKRHLLQRPNPDETIMALLWEYKERGQKGYELSSTFFDWFELKFGSRYTIQGPRRAGRDVMLHEVLVDFSTKIPADFLISRQDGTPLVIGFVRYDSDRGGSQEDDRTGGNRDKTTEILEYARRKQIPLKLLFINDGPGLLLGSMWTDYANLEDYGGLSVRVCTLKMLDERVTSEWIDH